VLEDVTDIVLNIKGLAVDLEGDEPRTMSVEGHGKGAITAADIKADANIRIVNPEHHLATLTDDVEFAADMWVEKGPRLAWCRGQSEGEVDIDVFPIDSSFRRLRGCATRTEDTRVGQRTNYDRLIMEVWTNGTVAPEDALVEAAKILRKHLNPFVQYHELGEEEINEPLEDVAPPQPRIDADLQAKLDMTIHASIFPSGPTTVWSRRGSEPWASWPAAPRRAAARAQFRQDLASGGQAASSQNWACHWVWTLVARRDRGSAGAPKRSPRSAVPR